MKISKKVPELRRELHKHPEVAGEEKETARRIRRFIEDNSDARLISEIGGNGLAAIFEYSADGPVVMLRCELDALPIEETNSFAHKSATPGVSHKCGHDGHMAIVAGMVFWLSTQTFSRGKVVLLFQPAEENGTGAFKVLNDKKFGEITPDFVFALHNIPGESTNKVVVIEETFSPTVQSFSISLEGKTSHASEPERGINPAQAIAALIEEFSRLNQPDTTREDFALVTPVCINMGTVDYGISPGAGEVHYTMRCVQETLMHNLKESVVAICRKICNDQKLKFTVDWFDFFPATVNDIFCNEQVRKAAKSYNLDIVEQQHPMKFGEDFGWFSRNYKVALFGLGSGENHPALHHADYDFPDELLPTGIFLFRQIIEQILDEK